MVQTYSDNKLIYSVDMMFTYINIYKPKSSTMPIEKLKHNLDFNGWGTPETGNLYSPSDVIKNPRKYKKEILRIKRSDLNYPIIIHIKRKKAYVVDGMHRLVKSILSGKKDIKVLVFSSKLMRKFLINKKGNWKEVSKMSLYQYIELFSLRFSKN